MADSSLAPTHGREQSKSAPEKLGHWLFKQSSNWRIVLAFLLVAALTYISIRFNIELGRLSAVDETSKELLPSGYALLDLCALFLSGYIGLKTKSPVRKVIAWVWFAFLVCLSLWAAAAFTMSVDYRQSLAPLNSQIERKRAELATQQASVQTWQDNVAAAKIYKTKHQGTLSREQAKEAMIAGDLAHLEAQRVPAAQIIYERAAPYIGVDAETLQLIVRLAWAAAITLSPLVLALLIGAEVIAHSHQSQPETNSPTPSPEGKKRKGKFHNLTNSGKGEVTQTGKPQAPSLAPVMAKAGKKRGKKAAPRTGDSADTGTQAGKATRYAEVRQQVIAGKVRPSKPAIKKAAQCGQPTAEKYLEAMAKEGIIQKLPNGRYALSESNIVPITAKGRGVGAIQQRTVGQARKQRIKAGGIGQE
jgi:hypothetical protein